MQTVLTVTLPLFVLVLAGYVGGKRGLITAEGVKGITGFVFWFALPLLLFRAMALAPVREAFDFRFPLAMLLAALGSAVVAMVVARLLFRCPTAELGVFGFGASFGNSVFLGMPVALAIFGEVALLPMTLMITIENAVLIPLALVWLEVTRGHGNRWAPLTALLAVVRNPIIVSAMAGLAVAALGWSLPAMVDGLARVAGGAAVPAALFSLGAILSFQPLSERLGETLTLAGAKLFLHPAMAFLALLLFPGLDPEWRLIGLLAATMPIGANVFLAAQNYGVYAARASTAVLVSTAAAVVTVSLAAVWLAPA